MTRTLPYIALLLTAILSQIFIFDQIAASVYVAPLVYIIYIALLPVQTSQIKMLLAGVMLGVVMDAVMGTDGLNSIATIAVAFFRASIIRLLVGAERSAERVIPSRLSFGSGDFLRYLAIIIALHHFIFFFFESLSFSFLLLFAIRFVVSSTISIIYVWALSRIFVVNNFLK
ncbi:MAG: rod shape-determining protein MreD [Rikenellaceae bacterium]